MNKHKEIRIETSPDEMFRVEQFVEEISDEFLLYGNYFGNILMAVSEAVKNAIVHGNKMDRLKQVKVLMDSTTDGLWISVVDQGDGFNYREYEKRPSRNLDLPKNKNGLFLINKLADEVRFRENGRVIEMLFRINGIDESIFERRVAFMQEFFRVYQKLSS